MADFHESDHNSRDHRSLTEHSRFEDTWFEGPSPNVNTFLNAGVVLSRFLAKSRRNLVFRRVGLALPFLIDEQMSAVHTPRFTQTS